MNSAVLLGAIAKRLNLVAVGIARGISPTEVWWAANGVRRRAKLVLGIHQLQFPSDVTIARARPLVADESVDIVLSNCVLNLVRPEDKEQLFGEMFRVVRRGGRVAISDIVSDEEVSDELQRDPEMWSGCIAGAYREDAFIDAFDRAGFYGMEIVKRDEKPWRIIQGIEFHSITVVARKGKQGPCWERKQAVIYRGPWRKVIDDDGHALERGKRMAVCDKTFQIYTREPYASDVLPIESYTLSRLRAVAFDCRRSAVRNPRETKGLDYQVTVCLEKTVVSRRRSAAN